MFNNHFYLSVCAAALFASACANESADPASSPAAEQVSSPISQNATFERVADCVIDTPSFRDAVELTNDLEASIDLEFIKDFGPQYYKQVRIPKALQIPLVKTDEFGSYAYSFHGWDLVPHDLVPEGIEAEGQFAMIEGRPVFEAKRVFAQKKRIVAEAIFNALTRATEVRTEHIVPKQNVYDQSWIRIRRSTPHNRLVCDSVVYPDSSTTEATFTCVFSKVTMKTIQAYDTDESGSACPSP